VIDREAKLGASEGVAAEVNEHGRLGLGQRLVFTLRFGVAEGGSGPCRGEKIAHDEGGSCLRERRYRATQPIGKGRAGA
jgi:hypothetical protein